MINQLPISFYILIGRSTKDGSCYHKLKMNTRDLLRYIYLHSRGISNVNNMYKINQLFILGWCSLNQLQAQTCLIAAAAAISAPTDVMSKKSTWFGREKWHICEKPHGPRWFSAHKCAAASSSKLCFFLVLSNFQTVRNKGYLLWRLNLFSWQIRVGQ